MQCQILHEYSCEFTLSVSRLGMFMWCTKGSILACGCADVSLLRAVDKRMTGLGVDRYYFSIIWLLKLKWKGWQKLEDYVKWCHLLSSVCV